MTGAIVTTHYRYKRPSSKRKAVALEVPAIVWRKRGAKEEPEPKAASVAPPATHDRKSAIVTARRPSATRFGDAPDLTPEEYQRRGDAADALFREMKRRIAEKKR